MYQLEFDDGVNPPTVTNPKLNQEAALWWADRAREITSTSAVNIVHEVSDWLTERLPQNAEVQSDCQ